MVSSGKFLLAAGGTGGHIFPALAVAEQLRELGADVLFVGLGRDLEEKIISGSGFDREIVPSLPVVGAGLGGVAQACLKFPRNLQRALDVVRGYGPDVVMGFGGFPAFLPILAAKLLGLPVYLQEQNAEVGVANKVASLFANKIFAVPGARGFWRSNRVVDCSNPVREVFRQISELDSPDSSRKFTLLVVGGSQGAIAVNQVVLDIRSLFSRLGIKVIHQTGAGDFERVLREYKAGKFADYEVLPFIDKIADYYNRAHLIISRSGAMTVAEVAAAGRPAIFIPLPISKGHQEANTRDLVNKGLSLVVKQGPKLLGELTEAISFLYSNPEKMLRMAKGLRSYSGIEDGGAAKRIAQELMENAQAKQAGKKDC